MSNKLQFVDLWANTHSEIKLDGTFFWMMMGKNKSHQASRYRELADHVAVVKKADDRIIGFAESERQGITASSDQEPDGGVSLRLSGYSPQGEEDS